jgi:hypothetical protein
MQFHFLFFLGAHNDAKKTKAECWKKISAETEQNWNNLKQRA